LSSFLSWKMKIWYNNRSHEQFSVSFLCTINNDHVNGHENKNWIYPRTYRIRFKTTPITITPGNC
jgi:hypothetical protein